MDETAAAAVAGAVAQQPATVVELDAIQSKIAQLEASKSGGSLKQEDDKAITKAWKKDMKETTASLDAIESMEERYDALMKRFQLVTLDLKRANTLLGSNKKRVEDLTRERDVARLELAKMTATKDKLEQLSRELTKQTKLVKDEARRMQEEDAQKRMEQSERFQKQIDDIMQRMQQDNEVKAKQAADTDQMREKFKVFIEQYELREQHHEKVLKTKDLEIRLAETRLSQQTQLAEQADRQAALLKEQYAAAILAEQALKAELALYGEKFESIQESLTKSNEVFAAFKKEREKAAKVNAKLEKEAATWRQHFEKTNKTLIEMLEEKNEQAKNAQAAQAKIEQLEKLCRALQGQVTELRKTAAPAAAAPAPAPAAVTEATPAATPAAASS